MIVVVSHLNEEGKYSENRIIGWHFLYLCLVRCVELTLYLGGKIERMYIRKLNDRLTIFVHFLIYISLPLSRHHCLDTTIESDAKNSQFTLHCLRINVRGRIFSDVGRLP